MHVPRSEAMTANEARARAAHYREIARLITDVQTSERLLQLAAKYEALAEEIAAEAPESKPQPGAAEQSGDGRFDPDQG